MFHRCNLKQWRKGFKSDLISVYLKLERKQINNLQSNKNSTLKCLWSSIVARKEKTKCKRNMGITFKNQEKNSFYTEEMFALYSA